MANYKNSALGRGSAGFTRTVTLHGGPAHIERMFLQATGTSAVVRFFDAPNGTGNQIGPDINLASGQSNHGPSELIQGDTGLSMVVTFPTDDFRSFAHLNVEVETSVDTLATLENFDQLLRGDINEVVTGDWDFSTTPTLDGQTVGAVVAYGDESDAPDFNTYPANTVFVEYDEDGSV